MRTLTVGLLTVKYSRRMELTLKTARGFRCWTGAALALFLTSPECLAAVEAWSARTFPRNDVDAPTDTPR